MAIWLRTAGFRVFPVLGLMVLLLCLPASAASGLLGGRRHKTPADGAAADKPAVAASQPPAFSISVDPLGFSAPGAFYQGQRESLVSLDFLDENRLLFTFRAPGLMHRTGGADGNARQIRAFVLSLPQGTVETEALWTIHGRDRYLWMLGGGRFLVRDGDTLKDGDATLDLKPMLHFPGPLLWLEMDPAAQFLVTDSSEPAAAQPPPDRVPSPDTAGADVEEQEPRSEGAPGIVLRILRRSSGQVLLVSRVRTIVHLPISAEGYLEALRSTGRDWMLNLNYFTGGSKVLGKVPSSCTPPLLFLKSDVVLANACVPQGGRDLIALTTDGRKLWDAPAPPTQVWPLLVSAPTGTRLARETLTVSHPVDTYSPLSFDDVTGQVVEVFDSATGKLVLKAPAAPLLDGGGNLALSPSGRRVAVLSAGSIQIYELPTPPAM